MVRYLVGNKVVTSSVGNHYHTENQVAGTSCQAPRLYSRSTVQCSYITQM